MAFHLVVAKGRHQGKAIPLKHFPFVIGRHKNCQLCAASMEISRQHCAIDNQDGTLVVKDMGSTNGTFINHRKIDGALELQDQDLIQVGPLALTVCLEPAPPTADTHPGVIATADTHPGVDQPTPLPASLGDVDEDGAATLLLQLDDLPAPESKPAPKPPEPAASGGGEKKAMTAAQRILEQYKKK